MRQRIPAGIILSLTAVTSNAALFSRLSGQAYYDDVLNITWLADANLAQTSGYDADGLMTWSAGQVWVGTLNTANYLGVNDWRLPTVTDTDTPGCTVGYTGTDCGYNMDLTTGEMAHLFYGTLGNIGYFDTSGTPTGCTGPDLCLTNAGPFVNLAHAYPNRYMTGAEYAPDASIAWTFYFDYGNQSADFKIDPSYAWAVLDGDISPVPIPPALWLLSSALGVLVWVRRPTAA